MFLCWSAPQSCMVHSSSILTFPLSTVLSWSVHPCILALSPTWKVGCLCFPSNYFCFCWALSLFDLALPLTSSAHSIITSICASRSDLTSCTPASSSLTSYGKVEISIGSHSLGLYQKKLKGCVFAWGLSLSGKQGTYIQTCMVPTSCDCEL